MKKNIFLAILSMLLVNPLFAQDTTFTASAPGSVRMGEIFDLIYTINQKADSFSVKPFKDFEIISGPTSSSSSNLTIINGKTTQRYEITYRYELKATTKGQFVIPEASVIIKGRKYYSNRLAIDVTNTPKKLQSDSVKIPKNELYIDLSFSKKEVYVQEALTATLILYSSNDINDVKDIEFPAFDDFLLYDLSDSIVRAKIDTVDGKKNISAVLKRVLIYPLKSGKIQIKKVKLNCIVMTALKKEKSKSVFDDFFGPSYKSIEQSLETDSQTITVKPMPEKQPADFIQVCGTTIKLTATVNKTTVKANTPFIYEMTLSGNGNLKLVSIPKIILPIEFKEVSNGANNNLKYKIDGITGNRTFSYTIIPKQTGDFKIPAHSLTYFDLDAKQYKTISTLPVWINVEKNQETPVALKDSISPEKANARTEDCDLLIVMDVSTTMLAQDLKPNRLEASVNATKQFLQTQKGKVGLVIFSENSKLKCPLMSNLNVIKDSLSTISDLELGNGTAIGIGLSNAILELKKSNAKAKAIILFTDGANNMGSITPKMAARLARSFGIKIYAIGVSGKDSLASCPNKSSADMEMIKIPVNIDEKMLKEIANSTAGKYFRAIDANSFDAIFQEIAKIITIKKTNDQSINDISKEDAERILNIVSQDIEELKEKLRKK